MEHDSHEQPDRIPHVLARVGGPAERVTVGLRIFGDDVEPDEITALLGCPPSVARRRGDVVEGRARQRVARTGSWILNSNGPGSEPLDAQVRRLLDGLTGDLSAWAALTRRFKVDLFCGVFMGGWNRGIDAETMRALADRNVPLGFDIYATGESE